MKPKTSKDKGSILIIALILLVVIAFAASSSLMNSVVNLKIGGNYADTITVFNLAELGIARGKLLAKEAVDMDDLLNPANYPGGVLIPEQQEDGGTYEVTVENNIIGLHPDTGGATNDTDYIVVLTSTAYGNKGNKVEIETYVGRPVTITFPQVPGMPGAGGGGAIGVCGESPGIRAWGSGNIRGEEYDIDGNLLSPATGTYGIVMENAGTVRDKKAGSVTGHLGDENVNANLPCTEWHNLSNQLAALGPGPNVQILTSNVSGGTWGTEANPKITIINTASSSFKINGSVSGAGVIVMACEAELRLLGNLDFKGIIMVMGDDGQIKAQGSMEHLGYMIVNNSIADSDWEVNFTGNGWTGYSSEAIALAQDAINGAAGAGGGGGGAPGTQLFTYSWAERY